MNTNMNTRRLKHALPIRVSINFESCTENPCVGGSIPPLGTINALLIIPLLKTNSAQNYFRYGIINL